MLKSLGILLAPLVAICLAFANPGRAADASSPLKIETPEVYELANVILALTSYGQSDPLEVQKGTDYYNLVMERFSPYADHPLIAQVNYSREAWESYLGFRTDAYAFAFDDAGRLRRTSDFRSTSLTPFDEHLALVEDFAKVSGFRAFYREQAPFFAQLRQRYANAYFISESRAFLEREFGTTFTGDYRAILSPLVGRMNAQRPFEGAQLSFVNVAPELLNGEGVLSASDQLMEYHTLFTELDHAYVNPVSSEHGAAIDAGFDPAVWNTSDGYRSAQATFNEYMTWAAYDLLSRELAPGQAEQAIANWHFINKRRGFVASELFAQKLAELYNRRQANERVRDLYPALLAWASEQKAFVAPVIVSEKTVPVTEGATEVILRFSVPMQPRDRLTVSRVHWDGARFQKSGNIELTDLHWSTDGQTLRFMYQVPADDRASLSFNLADNTPIISQAGLYLRPGERIEFVRSQPPP